MKTRLIIFLATILITIQLNAQRPEKKVLFMLPFHIENAGIDETIKSESDLYGNSSYQMLGFWEGAQMALDIYNKDYVKIKVIARDVTNEQQLNSVLEEMKNEEIDLIIGPLFSKEFAIAAEYAKANEIPIVNPFSNRTDFLEENPYVYKTIPSMATRPQALYTLLLSHLNDYNIILWTSEKNKTKDQPYYEIFFTNKGIEYTSSPLKDGFAALKKKLSPNKKDIIIALFENEDVATIQQIQSLALTEDTSITIIAPESWLDIRNIQYSYLNQLNTHFFTNYFIDKKDPAIQLFADNYITSFGSYPDLNRFSYQGYDITNYFISLLLSNFDMTHVSYTPLAFEFEFENEKGNGYENNHQRLIKMENLQLKEVK